MISSLVESLLESIDKVLSEGRISWGAIITALLFFNKINKYKEFRARDKRVELRQQRIESKIDDLMLERGVVSTWSFQENGSTNTVLPMQKRLFPYLHKVIIRRGKNTMEKLKSRKLWLTIFGALFPVLNVELGINLDPNVVFAVLAVIISGIAGLAHVDAKKILASIKHIKVNPQDVELAYTTYKEALPHLQEIHSSINKLLNDVKQDNTSDAFKDAMSTYVQIKAILDRVKHPEPVIAIVDEQVPA